MRKEYLILILFFIIFSCSEKNNRDTTDHQELIDQIQVKFAPDKRVAIFTVSYENGIFRGETNLPEAKKELESLINSLSLIDSVNLLTPSYGLVNVSVCNIRSEPRHSAELSTQSLLGTPIQIYKQQNNWYYVQLPDGYLGWLDQGALVKITPQEYSDWQQDKKVVVVAPFDFIYADHTKEVRSDVVEGNILVAADRTDQFQTVKLPDGRTGIINGKSIISYERFLNTREPLLENILSTAHQFMGRPYLWGGTSGKGMDCSGFTKTIFYLNGLELPRDASQQAHIGVEINTDTTLQNLMPGDFIFFGNKKTSSQEEKITHVAMYLGEGKIIHASDRVQIESLKRRDPDFTEKRLISMVRAKRMLQNISENGVKKLVDHPIYNHHTTTESG